jgi:hypothetical protein
VQCTYNDGEIPHANCRSRGSKLHAVSARSSAYALSHCRSSGTSIVTEFGLEKAAISLGHIIALTLRHLSLFPEVHKGHCLRPTSAQGRSWILIYTLPRNCVQPTNFILTCNLYSGMLIWPRVMNSEDWTVAVALFFIWIDNCYPARSKKGIKNSGCRGNRRWVNLR